MGKMLVVTAFIISTGIGNMAFLSAQGNHFGEEQDLHISVEYLGSSGYTTTDYKGIHYHFYGMVFDELKIYPSWTYGQKYPLYFMGQDMNFRVTIKNIKEKGAKPFKIRVHAANFTMNTDGFAERIIAPPSQWIVESLRPGESKVIEGSINIPIDPTLPSGLDFTAIRVFHMNNGHDQNAGFIKEFRSVWCPPDIQTGNMRTKAE